MANRYWVGGTGNWSDANFWSTTSGGAGGASVPTSVDDVIFDAGSNVGTGTFTVTIDGDITTPSQCANFSTGGAGGALDGAMVLSSTSTVLECYGSMTLPATNFSISATSTSPAGLYFKTTGSATLTTNGVSLSTFIVFMTGTGTLTLGGAITGTGFIVVQNGTFTTANFNVTCNQFQIPGSNARIVNLGSSTLTLTGTTSVNISGSNITLNAGTSQITCSGATTTFVGAGLTFYNVSFTNTNAGSTTITGANSFNNLSQTSRSNTGFRAIVLSADQIVSGTLTLGAANTAIRKIQIQSNVSGSQRTITLNGTLATLADVSFRDINAAGTVATPWTGTRLGNAGGNNNITFDAPKNVYWNLAGIQNWSATGWATTNNGVPAVNNFPLPQDTATFTEAGAAGTVTFDVSWWVGSVQMADGVSNRTTAFTLATAAQSPNFYGNITLFSNLILSGTGNIIFAGYSVTQNITSAGITFSQALTFAGFGSTFKLLDNLTQTAVTGFTHNFGTVDLNNKVLTCYLWSSSNTNTRAIAFGTSGQITVTANGGNVWLANILTNFSFTGTSNVIFNYSGSVGTRTIQHGNTSGGTEANALSISITAGADIISVGSSRVKDFIFSGFTGTWSNLSSPVFVGNLTLVSGMTTTASTSTTTFAATSGTQQITTNGVLLDFPLVFNGLGGTFAFQDALTQGSTKAFTFTNGTIQFKNGTTNTVGIFSTTGTTQKFLQSTLSGSQATINQASGTVTASYLTIKDSNAIGGAIWDSYLTNNNVDGGNNSGWNFFTTMFGNASVSAFATVSANGKIIGEEWVNVPPDSDTWINI